MARARYYQCTLTSKDGKTRYQGVGWTKKEAESNAAERAPGNKADYDSVTRRMAGPKPRMLSKKKPAKRRKRK
jgi:hypothetical protein